MKCFCIIFEVLATSFENFIVLECCGKLFGYKYAGTKKIFCFLLFLVITTCYVTFLNYIVTFEGWLNIITVLFFIIYCLLCLNGSAFKKILVPLALFSAILCINSFVTFTFSSFLHISSESLMSMNNGIRFITLFITKFMFFIVTRVFLHIFKGNIFELKKIDIFMNSVLMLFTYSIGIIVVEVQIKHENQSLLGFISSFCIIGVNILAFYMIRRFTDENEKEVQITLLKMQLSEQKAMIEDAANVGKEVKRTEHDLKHHFLSILGLLEENHLDEAEHYIKSLLGQYEMGVFKYISIDNSAINGILNFKISRCRANHIDIKIAIESDFSVFDELDICVLLSNLLDNAIEASMDISIPKIELSITNRGNYLCILIRNKIERSILAHNNSLQTTKKDFTTHGFGLYSVSKIVEKYDGIKNIYEKNDYFTVDVWLKRNQYDIQKRIKESALC